MVVDLRHRAGLGQAIFGRMVGDERQGLLALYRDVLLFVVGVVICLLGGGSPAIRFKALGLTGGNMEGKEVRFGIPLSALFAVVTTAASCGAVNAMHDSFTALGGMFPLINIQLGEIVIGGVGAGLYGMLLFAILAIFVAGLMVGRTPDIRQEDRGEGGEAGHARHPDPAAGVSRLDRDRRRPSHGRRLDRESRAARLQRGALRLRVADCQQRLRLRRAHRQYLFYNVTGGIAMLVGRFIMIVPAMAIAASLAAKKSIPESVARFRRPAAFIGLVVGVIVIIGGLTFFPAIALGPLVDHISMIQGQTF